MLLPDMIKKTVKDLEALKELLDNSEQYDLMDDETRKQCIEEMVDLQYLIDNWKVYYRLHYKEEL